MTDKEMQKIKDSLPEWDKQNEEEQKLDEELDCRDMINSILIYGDLNKTIDEIYENKYLRNHKKVLSEERIKELIKEQQDDLKKSKINSNVYTDGEGVTYSSVTWYDEDNDKQEESKSLNESLGDRYEVWERYFEDGEVPDPKGELAATFDTYAEAVKYMEGLVKDPDCEAWIVDTMQKESKELNEDVEEKTKVIFRKDKEDGEIIAVFPEDKQEDNMLGCYVHLGQHTTMSIDYYNDETIPATPEEYADLKKELENIIGYNIEVISKLNESKELRKYNSRLYGVYDTEKEEYEEVGSLEDMKEKVESEKEEVEEKQEEPKEDKKDININITVKNENKEEYTQDYKDLYKKLDELIKANATDKELNDFLENASFNEVITNNEYLALQKKAQNARMIDLKKESLDDKNIILSKVFAQYLDITEEDEDYLNGLSLEELIIELKTRDWGDILEENKALKIDRTWDITVQSIDGIIEDINDEMNELHNKIQKIYDKYKTPKEADKDEELSLLMEQLGNLIHKLNKIKGVYNKALQDVLTIIDKKEENKEVKTEDIEPDYKDIPKLPEKLYKQVQQIKIVYDENMDNEEDDTFAGTQDSYANETLEDSLSELVYLYPTDEMKIYLWNNFDTTTQRAKIEAENFVFKKLKEAIVNDKLSKYKKSSSKKKTESKEAIRQLQQNYKKTLERELDKVQKAIENAGPGDISGLEDRRDFLVDKIGQLESDLNKKEESKSTNYEIEYAIPNYTGGNIYNYTGRLKDGTYFMANDSMYDGDYFDTWFVNEDPNKVEDDGAWYSDWQEEHKTEKQITDNKEANEFTIQLLNWIIKNKPEGNYAVEDMENLLKEMNNKVEAVENKQIKTESVDDEKFYEKICRAYIDTIYLEWVTTNPENNNSIVHGYFPDDDVAEKYDFGAKVTPENFKDIIAEESVAKTLIEYLGENYYYEYETWEDFYENYVKDEIAYDIYDTGLYSDGSTKYKEGMNHWDFYITKEDLIKLKLWNKEESKDVKTESYEEESVNPIINPEDRFYKDGHLFAVIIYSFGWSAVTIYYVYANYEQDALEILVPYLEENAPGLLIDAEDLEDEDLDNFITADGIYYFPAYTRIEELEGQEKEKIETEFFKNYKEEE